MKNSGVSLLISMGTSFLILALSVLMLASVSRSLERSSNLERSNQFFFAAESGIEEAFFHKNSRGVGVALGSKKDIFHEGNSASTTWNIESRDEAFFGLIRENETIQIPLFWDEQSDPAGSETEKRVDNINDLVINFYKDSAQMTDLFKDTEQSFKDLFEKKYGKVDINNFNFGSDSAEDMVLIDWSLNRQFKNSEPEKFSPLVDSDDPCSSAINYLICKDSFMNVTPLDLKGSTGKISPCYSLDPTAKYNASDPINSGCMITFDEFMEDTTGRRSPKVQITFRPILSFTDDKETPDLNDDEKIPGIPFTVTNSGNEIPKQKYTVTANVNIGNFRQQISIDVKEKTSIGAFDYVIFD